MDIREPRLAAPREGGAGRRALTRSAGLFSDAQIIRGSANVRRLSPRHLFTAPGGPEGFTFPPKIPEIAIGESSSRLGAKDSGVAEGPHRARRARVRCGVALDQDPSSALAIPGRRLARSQSTDGGSRVLGSRREPRDWSRTRQFLVEAPQSWAFVWAAAGAGTGSRAASAA